MALSFQERLKQARATALGRPVDKPVRSIAPRPPKIKLPKDVKPKPVKQVIIDAATQAKGIMQARKIKKLNNSVEEPTLDYTIGTGATSRARRLPTKELDLTNKVRVQVNAKTWVYTDPGYDLEALKAKYNPKPVKQRDLDGPPKYQF